MNKKNDVILSIGLIVKNEEKNLARCLDSLESLMKVIPCQLIITDTGSTDKTVEIAKKYTEEVYSFEWCDDFAAARNFGLEKAKGKWFMFMDADEWFEDTTEIENFFTSGEYLQYDNAAHKIRNYLYIQDKKDFLDQYVTRLFKMKESTNFVGRIHEYIPITSNNKYLSSYIHHLSYAKDLDIHEQNDKKERNLALILKCRQEQPEDMRMGYLLAQEYKAAEMMDKFAEVVVECYEALEKKPANPYYPYFLRYKAMQYKETIPQKGIELLQKHFNKKSTKQAWDLDLMSTLADLYHVNKEYEKAIESCDKYLDLFKKYESGKLKQGEAFLAAPPNFTSYEYSIVIKILKVKGFIRIGKLESALEVLEKFEMENLAMTEFSDVLLLLLYCSCELDNLQIIVNTYKKLLLAGDQLRIEKFRKLCEGYIEKNPDYLKPIRTAFVENAQEFEAEDDKYVLLHQLRFAIQNSEEEARMVIQRFFKVLGDDIPAELYSEFVVFGMAMGGSSVVSKIVHSIDVDDIQFYTKKSFNRYNNLPIVILRAFEKTDSFTGNTRDNKNIFWKLCLLEIAILGGRRLEISIRYELVKLYVKMGAEYLNRVYKDNILKDENVDILHRSLRFVYFADKGLKKATEKDYTESFSAFKQAVNNYPVLADEVKLILDKINSKEDSSTVQNMTPKIEFDFYAKTIKRKIVEISESGMHDEAIDLLSSYKKINPADKQGIEELERTLGLDN